MGHPLFDLTGRVAMVSGAASGFGRAVSIGYAEAGADLVLADIEPVGMQDTADRIVKLGRRAIPVKCDVSQPDQIRAMFATLDREYGKIDILANIAGQGYVKAPEDLPLEGLQFALQQLVVGRFCCCQEAGRRMLKAGKGSIINTGSLASVTALGRGHIAYSMAMGAVIQMTRELSTEWSGRGVRVNCIMPGQVPTEHNGLLERMAADEKLKDVFLRGIPMRRFGRSDEIVGVAIFLGSDASSWVSGALIAMDGGNLAKNAGGSHPGMPL
jgi:NAD(P)-dependent dehydrogenase (short-subunit alcohol dehydrogenase family)